MKYGFTFSSPCFPAVCHDAPNFFFISRLPTRPVQNLKRCSRRTTVFIIINVFRQINGSSVRAIYIYIYIHTTDQYFRFCTVLESELGSSQCTIAVRISPFFKKNVPHGTVSVGSYCFFYWTGANRPITVYPSGAQLKIQWSGVSAWIRRCKILSLDNSRMQCGVLL